MAQGVILAAGLSSRAKTNKMLLSYNDRPVINHTIECMLPFVEKIIVVTGHYHKEINNVIKKYEKVIVVKNDAYLDGMFSSIQKGASFIDDDFFIVPGDMPFIHPSTYELLLKERGLIKVPTYNTFKGHPIFIDKRLIKPLLLEPVTSNLKTFRDQFHVKLITTLDEGILKDIDTVEDIFTLNLTERNEDIGG
ncbi:nucleotidyltransferase family protein [Liberiplasma polymorphum]|uniref:nucleotidyltransferase family protein n=1 Tax=Liberiplasma polymorphum TaxID=3374570 RepID=UPI0037754961